MAKSQQQGPVRVISRQQLILAIILGVIAMMAVVFSVLLLSGTIRNLTRPAVRCVPTGCSGEICADENAAGNGFASTCIYSNRFACVKKTKCELQDDGKCGWTPNSEYNQCLIDNSKPPVGL